MSTPKDLDVCETGISNAIYSDDGQTYVFKNNYYWKTNPLNTSTGIIGFADLVSNKWSEVKGDINLVFVIHKEELKRLITVFVVVCSLMSLVILNTIITLICS